jgi:hypothetical protein
MSIEKGKRIGIKTVDDIIPRLHPRRRHRLHRRRLWPWSLHPRLRCRMRPRPHLRRLRLRHERFCASWGRGLAIH